MKKISVLALAVVSACASADLFVNGGFASGPASFRTGVGNGFGGADTSVIDGGSYGWNANQGAYRIADDFTVTGAGWNLSDMTFYTYQTGANLQNTYTGFTVAIYGAQPVNETDAPLYGSTTTSVFASSIDTGIYRVTSANLLDTNRRVYGVTGNLSGITLGPGTYWASISFTGSASFSGPWAVSITPYPGQIGGGAMQAPVNGVYAGITDTIGGTTVNQNMAFTINYTPVPEPATLAGLGLGALALLRRRRKA